MVTDVTSIRLPPKDALMVDHFVESGEFKSRSEFIRFAVKKVINEMILKEFHEKLSEDKKMSKKDLNKLQKEIKDIRKKLWKNMLNIYLDTNIYIIGLLYPETNSARILKEITKGNYTITQSDYLFDEVLTWFRQRKGKGIVGSVRSYMLSIPAREFVHKLEWGLFIDELKAKVTDSDDNYDWDTAELTASKSKTINLLKINFLDRFPLISKILQIFIFKNLLTILKTHR